MRPMRDGNLQVIMPMILEVSEGTRKYVGSNYRDEKEAFVKRIAFAEQNAYDIKIVPMPQLVVSK